MNENENEQMPVGVPAADDGGALGRLLTKWFGRSYRTSIAGAIGFVGQGAYIAFQVSQGHLTMEQAIPLVLGMLTSAGLLVAKDNKVSGLPTPRV